jgi:hypothetical protein
MYEHVHRPHAPVSIPPEGRQGRGNDHLRSSACRAVSGPASLRPEPTRTTAPASLARSPWLPRPDVAPPRTECLRRQSERSLVRQDRPSWPEPGLHPGALHVASRRLAASRSASDERLPTHAHPAAASPRQPAPSLPPTIDDVDQAPSGPRHAGPALGALLRCLLLAHAPDRANPLVSLFREGAEDYLELNSIWQPRQMVGSRPRPCAICPVCAA